MEYCSLLETFTMANSFIATVTIYRIVSEEYSTGSYLTG